MANLKRTVRNAVHTCAQKYRQHERDKRDMADLQRHNELLGMHVSWKEFRRARDLTGCTVDEYYLFEFYDKSDKERDAYLTMPRQGEIARKVGDKLVAYTIPGNKILFNTLFDDLVRREWLNPSACTGAEFVDFFRRHGEILVKRSDWWQGRGISKYVYDGEAQALELFKTLCGTGSLVEEVLQQHPRMNELNPYSVNSIRVGIYADADDVHVLGAGLKTSVREDSFVDNLHNGGCVCAVDLQTGTVTSNAFNQMAHQYTAHPCTGVPYKGFQIPHWERLLETAKLAARRAYRYQCHWIGWDLAVLPDGVALIEGNWWPGTDLVQCGQKGLYYQLLQLSEKL